MLSASRTVIKQNTRAFSIFSKRSPAYPLDRCPPNCSNNEKITCPEGEARIATLSNGIKVITQDSHIPSASLGVLVDVGSRYEDSSVAGITNFLEGMILKSTHNRNTLSLYGDMAKLGADLYATSSREHLMITSQTASSVNPVLGAISDLIQEPKFAWSEIADHVAAYKIENKNRGSQPDVIVNDAIHAAAFGNEGLGASMFAHDADLEKFDENTLSLWHDHFFTPERLTISAIGVQHESFVALCEEAMGQIPKCEDEIKKVAPRYIGGDVRITDVEYKGLTHLALGFNAPAWNSDDVYSASVLQMLFGGGGSFSSGGPGKGLYSRLYTNVLNKHHWIESANSFNTIYSDAGLFGLYGVAPPEAAGALFEVLSNEMRNAAVVTPEEVQRAKNLLKANVISYLENHGGRVEEAARFVQMFGEYDPRLILQKIDAVSVESVMAVQQKLTSSPVSIATYGDALDVPRNL